MNRLLLILVLVVVTVASAFSQSQREMNLVAQRNFEKADTRLNKVYQKLLTQCDAEAREKLKTAQRAWVVFRDAEADYAADDEARGGSLASLIYSNTQTQLTQERTAHFQKLLAISTPEVSGASRSSGSARVSRVPFCVSRKGFDVNGPLSNSALRRTERGEIACRRQPVGFARKRKANTSKNTRDACAPGDVATFF
ncbi:MAG: lysozyme inhibitor LprI family protein [Chthoniobacterales bacterium]